MSPWFKGENVARNLALVETLKTIAAAQGATDAQAASAWVAAQGDDIGPFEAVGRRDPELTLRTLDSERR
jgi:aryl-alcohol dehydrogenase-like predicted oxidoreductase